MVLRPFTGLCALAVSSVRLSQDREVPVRPHLAFWMEYLILNTELHRGRAGESPGEEGLRFRWLDSPWQGKENDKTMKVSLERKY